MMQLNPVHRMLTYDPESALVLLHDAPCALLVDVTLCIDTNALLSVSDTQDHRWALDRKAYVWVVGHLEGVHVGLILFVNRALTPPNHQEPLPIPMLPAYLAPPHIDPSLVLRAVIVAPAKDLNTAQLRAALAAMAEVS